MRFLFALLVTAIVVLPAQATMDISREIVAPKNVAPGQPITVAVTFWTDRWFNPPPKWPQFPVQNGVVLNTPQPSQLLTRQKNGINWSGIRMERQIMTWDQSTLHLPAIDLTLTSSPPVTVHLDALNLPVVWPKGIEEPDRFLPASNLTLTQTIIQYHAGDDKKLRAGDVVERVVTVQAQNVLPAQIPQILYAIPGDNSQQLVPENRPLKSGRGYLNGAIHVEHLRYMLTKAGKIVLPPIKLRWWDTDHQQWQLTELPGQTLNVGRSRAAGKESVLEGHSEKEWQMTLTLLTLCVIVAIGWFTRSQLHYTSVKLMPRWRSFWRPVPLPKLA